jgi:DNA-binding transcriptional MerR regulator/effector-binding domain-containing protein
MRNLLPIGRFSEMCRLSIPALRHYDDLGLLPPAAVDPDTGYRYYSAGQAADAERIRTLRFLEMPLPEIRAILSSDPDHARALLEAHRQRLVAQADRQRYAISLLETMLTEAPPTAYEIRLRETKPQLVASLRGRSPWSALGLFVPNAMMEVFAAAGEQGVRIAGPAYAAYHSADTTEAEVELEVGIPVDEALEPAGRVSGTTIAGGLVAVTMHAGRYEEIGRAYQALGTWVQEHGHETAGPPREVYLVGPDQVREDGALRTEVLWPIK